MSESDTKRRSKKVTPYIDPARLKKLDEFCRQNNICHEDGISNYGKAMRILIDNIPELSAAKQEQTPPAAEAKSIEYIVGDDVADKTAPQTREAKPSEELYTQLNDMVKDAIDRMNLVTFEQLNAFLSEQARLRSYEPSKPDCPYDGSCHARVRCHWSCTNDPHHLR